MSGSLRLRRRGRDRIINPRGLCPKKGEVMAFNCKDLAVSGFEGDFDKENYPNGCPSKSCNTCFCSTYEIRGGAVENSSNLSILRQQLQQSLA